MALEGEVTFSHIGAGLELSQRAEIEEIIAANEFTVFNETIDPDTVVRAMQMFDALLPEDRRPIRDAIFHLYGFERAMTLDAVSVTNEMYEHLNDQDFFPFVPAIYRNTGHMPVIYVHDTGAMGLIRVTPEY